MKRFSSVVLLVVGLLSCVFCGSVMAQETRSHLSFYPVLYPDMTAELLMQIDSKLGKQLKEQNPLLRYVQTATEDLSNNRAGVTFPALAAKDSAAVAQLLALAQEKKYVKKGIRLVLGPDLTDTTLCAVYALEVSDRYAIRQAFVTEVKKERGFSGNPEIFVTMTEETSRQFAELTRVHLLKHIAICCGDEVFSVPRVAMPIDGGVCAISVSGETEQARLYRLLTGE